MTSADVPEDEVYEMTKALFENQDRLVAAHTVMRNFVPQNAASSPGVELHPGAQRYYNKAGVAQ